MAVRDLTPSRGYKPPHRLAPAEDPEPASELRVQAEPAARERPEIAAPILHFSTGGPTAVRLRLMRFFNEERSYVAARQLLDTGAAQLRRFQEYSLLWIFDVLNGSPSARIHRRLAERYRATAAQKAAFIENVAFELIVGGKWTETKEHCQAALDVHPASQGMWINLLVAMSLLKQRDSVEEVLLKLPEVVDIDNGLLGVYLWEAPDLSRPVCNGG